MGLVDVIDVYVCGLFEVFVDIGVDIVNMDVGCLGIVVNLQVGYFVGKLFYIGDILGFYGLFGYSGDSYWSIYQGFSLFMGCNYYFFQVLCLGGY